MTPDLTAATAIYESASDFMAKAGFRAEMEWQRDIRFSEFSESDLLRETAWVILCSGFRERVVRSVFDYISLCFCDWESAEAIVRSDPACRLAALASFGNRSKIDAIVDTAYYVRDVGFDRFKTNVLADPLIELRRLPYIGPVTVFHLAKNLGMDVAKPDRHLARLAVQLGFGSADHLCRELARLTGEQLKVVDLVIWRYLAELNGDQASNVA